MNAWVLLILGIFFEVLGSFFLKKSHGFSNLILSIIGFLSFFVALVLITMSAKFLEIGVVYAVWSGMGIFIISVVDMGFLGGDISFKKIVFTCFIVFGVLGLYLESVTDNRGQEDGYFTE